MHVILPRSGFELGSIQGEEPLYRLQYRSGNATERFQLDRGSPFGADAPKGSLNELIHFFFNTVFFTRLMETAYEITL